MGNGRWCDSTHQRLLIYGGCYSIKRSARGSWIIPTHVGNTQTRPGADSRVPVHPHTRGEHSISMNCSGLQPGSSPRMWGTLYDCALGPLLRRFIPTHVGNTPRTSSGNWSSSVHPHACGEHGTAGMPFRTAFGSSPRMWGTLTLCLPHGPGDRFIPTHVGNTGEIHCGMQLLSVHPHACGEHMRASVRVRRVDGSSPRMWGTHRPRPARL